MVKLFILQLVFMILTTSIDTLSFGIELIKGLRRVRLPSDEIILEWIKEVDQLIEASQLIEARQLKAYLAFLNAARAEINPRGESGKVVYYPGIGPYALYLDLILPLIAVDCDSVVSVDRGRDAGEEINLANFQYWVRLSLQTLIDNRIVPEKEIKFQQEGDDKYSFSFPFGGRERKVVIYYNKDAGNFFPQELEFGFDVLMTRWIPRGFVVNPDISEKWLQHMKPPGFIITSSAPGESYLDGEFCDLILPPDFRAKFSPPVMHGKFLIRNIFLLPRRGD